jgi:hypothetical protein
MSNTQYRAYLESTIQLARSMLIKSVAIEQQLNDAERAIGREVSTDPTTWVYYRHLAGEYTPYDTPMRVVSFDTSEEIDFRVEVLVDHPVTRLQYLFEHTHYNHLIQRYPTQEFLIRGILQPVNKTAAIAADDFQLLDYDHQRVEPNEHGLIPQIQQHLNEFRVRWDNPAYNVTDDLYSSASLAVLYGRLPGWILNHRLRCCKTPQAHSFHMREYLKSHGRLDRHFTYLNTEQRLWLYRNILYIERNAGKQHTFDWISSHLLTQRGLGFGEYDFKHNVSDMPDSALSPTPEGYLNPINAFYRHDQKQENSIEALLLKQRPLAPGNQREEPKVLNDDYARMQHSRRARLPTKSLESATIDWSESGTLYRSTLLLNYWLYCSVNGEYQADILFRHPRDNRALQLDTQSAFILFLYAYNRANGVILETIPPLTANMIRRYPTPSVEALAALVQTETIAPKNADVLHPEDVDYVARQAFEPTTMYSTTQFIEEISARYETFRQQRDFYGLEEQHRRRAQKQALMDHLYMDVEVAFAQTGQTYTRWLSDIQFYPTELSDHEYREIADALMVNATGFGLMGASQLSLIQQAMLNIMRQLSSYSIHFIQSINYGPILFWEWPAFRPGQIDVKGRSGLLAKFLSLIPSDARYRGYIGYWHDLNRVHYQDYTFKGSLTLKMPVPTVFYTSDQRTDYLRLPLARTYVHNVDQIQSDPAPAV